MLFGHNLVWPGEIQLRVKSKIFAQNREERKGCFFITLRAGELLRLFSMRFREVRFARFNPQITQIAQITMI